MDQGRARAGDDPDLGLLKPLGCEPPKRRKQPADEGQPERDVSGPRMPENEHNDKRQPVADSRHLTPDLMGRGWS